MDRKNFKQRLFFLKYALYRKDALRAYRMILRNQYLPPEELEDMNWVRRRRLLHFAWEKVPFYREKYGSLGLHPNDIKSPDDFRKIPPLTRRELKENFGALIAEGISPHDMRLSTTGGSTGIPVKVMHDKKAPVETYSWRMMDWWGIDPGMDGAFVWRCRRRNIIAALANQIAWYPTRKLRLDASRMTPRTVTVFLGKFNRLHPPLLQGYVGAIHHLALFIEENKVMVHSPRAIWVTASSLPAGQRQRIERVFRAPVYEEYGSAEIYWLAAQCRHRHGLHINSDGRYIEFADEQGAPVPSGTSGRILVTDLENFVFPIIRYENGDRGRTLAGQCPCGVRLPLMEEVKGRMTDMIILPGGGVISGAYLTTIFDDFPDAVKSFQIVQRADHSICLKYVPGLSSTILSYSLQKVRDELSRRTQGRVALTMEAVEEISHDRGKTRFVVSEVARRPSETAAE